MEVINEGHLYLLENFENKKNTGQLIQFIEKVPQTMLAKDGIEEIPTGVLITLNDGTTNEEILIMLIDRMYYLQNQFPCRENSIVITKLEESLMWLNNRTQYRVTSNIMYTDKEERVVKMLVIV